VQRVGDPWTDQGFSGGSGDGWDDAEDAADPDTDEALLGPEELEDDDAMDDDDSDDE
jgi:hypothetical protein